MQNPTELTALRDFTEWKEKCGVKGQPYCSLPNPCPTTSRELPGETIRLHTCMECPNNYPWILDPSGDGFSFKWLFCHPFSLPYRMLFHSHHANLFVKLKIITIKNKSNTENTVLFLLYLEFFQNVWFLESGVKFQVWRSKIVLHEFNIHHLNTLLFWLTLLIVSKK